MGAGYEILEHTADLGIRSWGPTGEEAFEQAGWALAEVIGIRASGAGELRVVRASGPDPGALLVELLNELILLHETEEAAVAGIRVVRLSETELEAEVGTVPLDRRPEGLGVKAATYHQLRVRETADGVEARVYLDV